MTDEQKCLEWLKHRRDNMPMAGAKRMVGIAISALEKQENDRWIPVTERLPEIGEYVLCQLPHAQSFGGGKIQVCKYCAPDKYRDKPYFDHFRDGFPNVLAWRPLPEPYTEEEA